jgi:hypothetical protein
MPVTDIRSGTNPIGVGPRPLDGTATGVGRISTADDAIHRFIDALGGAGNVVPNVVARAGDAVKLSPDGAIWLSASGNLVADPALDHPRNAIEMGDVLYQASLSSEAGTNLFTHPAITRDQKALALVSLQAAFNSANVDMPAAAGFQTKEQALQARSCAAVLMMDLAESLSAAKPEEAELQRKILGSYLKLLSEEPHGLARNFMIYDLEREKKELVPDVQPVIATLMEEVAQTKPPYEDWFKNGNDTLKVDYHVGNGFWDDELQFWTARGWERKDNADGTVTLKHAFNENGVVTKVEMLCHNGPDAMFKRMNDPSVGVVVYSGHADYGRNVTKRLADGAPLVGSKVFFGLQCAGKDIHNNILGKYTDLQIVQSKNSSYPNEDRSTLLNALEGFAQRRNWIEISKQNRETNSDNYYFPADTLLRKKAEDLDHNGVADVWDRVVHYNTFKPQSTIDQELTPKDPGVPAARLNGAAFEAAIMRLERLAGYNQWASELQNFRLLADGFYDGKPADPLFREIPARDDDGDLTKFQLNRNYAQASEETLGAMLCYRVGREAGQRAGLSESESKGSGLLMAAKCLAVDNGSLDQQIWNGLIKFEKLANVTYQDALAAAQIDHEMGAGTRETLDALMNTLGQKNIRL